MKVIRHLLPALASILALPSIVFAQVVSDDFEDGQLNPVLWVVKGPGTVVEQNGRAECFNEGQLTSNTQFDPNQAPLEIRGEFTLVSHSSGTPFVMVQWRAELEDTYTAGVTGAKADAQLVFDYPGGVGPPYTTVVALQDFQVANSSSASFRVNVGDTVAFLITDDAGSVTAQVDNLTTPDSATLTLQVATNNAFGNFFKFTGRADPYSTVVGLEWIEIQGQPDSDHDGLLDTQEDLNGNGLLDPGETDPYDQDTDDDGLSDGEEVFYSQPDRRWVESPVNSHWYRLTVDSVGFWEGEDMAAVQSGHLATVRDLAENDWLFDTFGNNFFPQGMWIGLNDEAVEGTFEWTSGETSVFDHWAQGNPTGGWLEDYVIIAGPGTNEPGLWRDQQDNAQFCALLEVPAGPQPEAGLDPLNPDSDGDQILDGTELGVTVGWPGDPGNGIAGTDLGIFIPDADPATTTDPLDRDSDDDGLLDHREDVDLNGRVDLGETDPLLTDTDLDGVQDGTESGKQHATGDTLTSVFVPDADPVSVTAPLLADSDSGGLTDGQEDHNSNGAIDPPGELDPNNPLDDTITLIVPPLVRGQFVTLVADGVRKNSKTWFCYSLKGSGPFTHPTYGFKLDLTPPITILGSANATSAGSVGYSATVPASIPVGLLVWLQAVEGWGQPVFSFRVSNSVASTVQ